MARYLERFRLVEVQQTFYRPPQLETVRRWRQQAPADFEFSLKAWQLITHPPSSPTYRRSGLKVPVGQEHSWGFFRPTPQVMAAWGRTRGIARVLAARLVVFQCPASFSETEVNVANMRAFFKAVAGEFLMAWEPRGQWNSQTIDALCRELGLVHCVDPFEQLPLWGSIRYFRLHGSPGYRHRYTDQELARLKALAGDTETYYLFNNIGMYEDASRFLALAGGAKFFCRCLHVIV